jgi:hypothetical protein
VTKTVYDAVKGALQDMTHAIVTTITKAFIMGPNQQGNDRNTQDDVKKKSAVELRQNIEQRPSQHGRQGRLPP